MKIPALALCLSLLVAAPASGHGEAEAHAEFVEVFAHDNDGFYFTVTGYDGRNPTILLAPGSVVTILFTNLGNASHNFRLSAVDTYGTELIAPGNSTSLPLRVPDEGFASYWCDPHKGSGMTGAVVSSENTAGKKSPGPGLAALGLVLALAASRRR